MAALTKRKALVPEEVVKFMRLPGLGPKTRAQDLEGARSHHPRRAEGGRRAATAAGAHGPRCEERGEDPDRARGGAAGPTRVAAPARRRAARPARARRGAASASCRGEGLRGGLGAPPPRDLPRPRRDRDLDGSGRADRALHRPGQRRLDRREGRHEGDRDHERGVPARPAGRATRVVREPAAALHRLEGPQRRAARGRGAPRASRSRSTRSRTPRPARSSRPPTRRSSTPTSATPTSRPSCGRTPASWRPPATASCRALVERSDLRGDLHSHSTWSDGKASIEQMARAAQALGHEYLAMCDHSPRLRDGRLQLQWEEIDALNEALAPFRILKGIEVNIRANGELDVADDDPRAARLGDGVRPHELRQGPDRARAARAGEPARRLHRPPDEPADQRPQSVRRSRSRRWSRAPWRRARSSRSTPSPTGSTCATRTLGSPVRRG